MAAKRPPFQTITPVEHIARILLSINDHLEVIARLAKQELQKRKQIEAERLEARYEGEDG